MIDRKYKSYAKINIGLHVMNKRADGYHNLQSIFQEVSLHDDIYLKRVVSGIKISSDNPDLPAGPHNLCWQAFELMKRRFDLPGGVEIKIRKRIPVGAGLGGGSSNAAACLKGINELFQLNLSKGKLIKLATQIGSDVPFFIPGKTALVKGRGEVVIPVDFLKNYRILIVNPKLQIPTESVYKKLELPLTESASNVKFEAVFSEIRFLGELNSFFYNDLEKIVIKEFPVISRLRKLILEAGAEFVSLSGSGSSIYGLFPKSTKYEEVRRSFSEKYMLFWVDPVLTGV